MQLPVLTKSQRELDSIMYFTVQGVFTESCYYFSGVESWSQWVKFIFEESWILFPKSKNAQKK